MSELAEFTGFVETATAIDTTIAGQIEAIEQMFGAAASATLIGAQGDALVDTGLLAGSGHIDVVQNGEETYIYVTFGDGSATSTTYSYPSSFATSQYNDGGMEAEGYAWFVELGHMSRGGTYVAPHPYLGPNFDSNANNLMSDFKGVYTG